MATAANPTQLTVSQNASGQIMPITANNPNPAPATPKVATPVKTVASKVTTPSSSTPSGTTNSDGTFTASNGVTYTSPQVAAQYNPEGQPGPSTPTASLTPQASGVIANAGNSATNPQGLPNIPGTPGYNPALPISVDTGTGNQVIAPAGASTNLNNTTLAKQAAAPIQPNIPGMPNYNPNLPTTSTTPGAPGSSTPSAGAQLAPSAQGLAAAQASGTPPPQTSGEASQAVSSFMAPVNNAATAAAQQEVQSNQINNTLNADPGFQQLMSDYQQLTSVENTSQSLVSQYNQMIQAAGIPAMDAQLVNWQNVMNGTQSDIEREVAASGGTMTQSQVLAMTTARNKTLVQNYNNLLNTEKMAQSQVTTMIGLAEKDQANALQNIKDKLSFDTQILTQEQKMTTAAQEGYKSVISAVGYNGLMAALGNNPTAIGLAEQTLGLAPGGLGQLAAIDQQKEDLATQTQEATLSKDQSAAQLAQAQVAEVPLDIQQKLAAIAASETSTAKNAFELNTEQANGGLSVAEVAKQNQLQANTTALQSYMTQNAGSDGYISPVTWQKAESAWVEDGNSAGDFAAVFGQFINPKHAADYKVGQ